MFTVAYELRFRPALLGFGIGVAYVALDFGSGRIEEIVQAGAQSGFYLLAWGIGRVVRGQERAACAAERDVVRAEEEARTAVADERARIARELHDAVAHSVSVMVLQAGAVRRLLARPDQRARARGAGRRRGDGPPGRRRAAPDARHPAQARRRRRARPVAAPAARRRAGRCARPASTRRSTIEGEPAELAPGVDMSAYRIVQEALTNAMRYAPGAHVDVTVSYGCDLRLEVRDDGASASTATRRPRAPATASSTCASARRCSAASSRPARRAGGGFVVKARLPRMTTRVVIADDQLLVRAGLKMVLEAEDDIEVVGEAADGEEVLEVVRNTKPDVVLMDIRMPVLDGLEASRRLLARDDPPKVLVLTTFDEEEYLYEALRAGTSGFLLKVSPPEQLIGAVRTVAAGNALIDPAVTRRVIAAFGRRARPSRRRASSRSSPPASSRCSNCSRAASPTRRSPPS